MKILVTGGAGFIGSNFVHRLMNFYDTQAIIESVIVLDALTYAGNMSNLENVLADSRVRFIKGNILDSDLVNEVMREVTHVVHFAAESHVDRSIADGKVFAQTNFLGTQVLLQSALDKKIKKFVHISTDEVYGSIESGSWSEDFPLKPNSPYSASKAGSDLLALSYFSTFSLPVSITRCSNNYGPRQHREKLIPLAITQLTHGEKIPIYGNGQNVRDWIHVNDHCDAIWKVLTKGLPGEIYNIGGGNELSNIELIKKLLQLSGKDLTMVEYVEDRKGHDRRYSVDDSKIRSELGYAPKVSLEAGLNDTFNWYRSQDNQQ